MVPSSCCAGDASLVPSLDFVEDELSKLAGPALDYCEKEYLVRYLKEHRIENLN